MRNIEDRKKRVRKYYWDNREAIKEQKKKYYQNNKERINAANSKYYAENKEKISITRKKYNLTHKEERKNRETKRKIEKPWAIHFQTAKQRCNYPNAKDYKWYGGKGVKFKLTMDEVRTLYLRDGAKDMERPSIDRIYNDGNYAFGNCRFLELSENIARRNRRVK